MQIFKLYFKLVKKKILVMMVVCMVFIGATGMMLAIEKTKSTLYNQEKFQVAFQCDDYQNVLTTGLYQYLKDYCNFIPVKEKQIDMEGRLFFYNISAVIKIPEGFTENFQNDKEAYILKEEVTDQRSMVLLDLAVDQYLSVVRTYQKAEGLSLLEAVEKAGEDFKEDNAVSWYMEETKDYTIICKYYNYLAYGIWCICIICIAGIMLSINSVKLKNRIAIAPVSSVNLYLQLWMGSLLLTFFVTSFFIVFGFFFIHKKYLDIQILLMSMNAYLFSLCGVSFGFLTGFVVKNKKHIAPVVHTLLVVMCLLGGVFVPQKELSNKIWQIGCFLPTYWYVKNNQLISSFQQISASRWEDIFKNYGIIFGFAAVFFVIALIVGKRNLKMEAD
ncbi:ABC transporter permease [Anaeromicropila populeti]|uniref:ABC-2 family transporter protein n=1 Tax=Anaeromicropila populeti TaxID=37658 RepID=A0A1I6KR18_9FIRM|nr:ABC transporter permease [Anaeromicropila populeti]SFR93695.1 ABC-2 family transporter protein [Anaeromicropila populeti]